MTEKQSRSTNNFFITLISTAGLSYILQLVFTKILTNFLEIADFGVLSLVISLSATISSLSLLEIQSGLYRYTLEYSATKNNIALRNCITSAYAFETFSSFIVLVILIVLNVLNIKLFQLENYIIMTFFSYLLGIGTAIFSLNLVIFTARMDNMGYSLLAVVPHLTKIIFTLFFIYFLGNMPFYVLIGIILNNFLVNVVTIAIVFKKFRIGKFSLKELTNLIHYGVPVFCLTGLNLLLIFIIQSSLLDIIGKEALALFSLSLSIISLLSILRTAVSYTYLGNILNIWDHDKDRKQVSNYANNSLRLFSSLFLIIAVIFYIFSPQIIILLSHEGYLGIIIVIPLIIIVNFFQIMRTMITVGIHAIKRPEMGAFSGFISFLLAVLSSAFLIPNFGLLGAVFSLLIYNSILTISLFIFSQKVFRIFFQRTIFIKILVVGFLSIILFNISFQFFGHEAKFFLLFFVISLLIMTRMLTINDIKIIVSNLMVLKRILVFKDE